jgi:hypothetical protein
MWNKTRNSVLRSLIGVPGLFLLLFFPLSSCNKPEKTAADDKDKKVTAEQTTFASPEDAGSAFLKAAQAGDRSTLLAIFGPNGTQVLFTGDVARDSTHLQDFVAAYKQMHRWNKINAGGQILDVGSDNYPFPIPLEQGPTGRWFFDTAAGRDEVLARRIGADERSAIAACEALSKAEHQYFNQSHPGDRVRQYAQKFASDPGRQNGLSWPAVDRRPSSPLANLGDFASALASSQGPSQFKGYNYRILTKQGDKAKGGAEDYTVNGKLTRGFAILAYPADYRNSGIVSFMVGPDGIVYQKDLGEQTARVAVAMTEYNPRDGWSLAVPDQLATSNAK